MSDHWSLACAALRASGYPAGAPAAPPAANSCHACGKTDGDLLRCSRCKNAWFCNRDCQRRAWKQGHKGAKRRPADGPPSVAHADPVQAFKDVVQLCESYTALVCEADTTRLTNTRKGFLAAIQKLEEAASVNNLIGGEGGAARRATAD